jgi:hypothetical protein
MGCALVWRSSTTLLVNAAHVRSKPAFNVAGSPTKQAGAREDDARRHRCRIASQVFLQGFSASAKQLGQLREIQELLHARVSTPVQVRARGTTDMRSPVSARGFLRPWLTCKGTLFYSPVRAAWCWMESD